MCAIQMAACSALAPTFPPPRMYKVAHAEVSEERQHRQRNRQLTMSHRAGTPLPAQMHYRRQCEHREQPRRLRRPPAKVPHSGA